MKLTVDDKKLLIRDYDGALKLISSKDGKLIKDFGIVHEYRITAITITSDQKFWFTSSGYGGLKQWNY